MPHEIQIGDMLLATLCDACKGTGWHRTEWTSSQGGDMTLVEEVKCDDCKSRGLLLTDAGNEMRRFIKLINE